MRNIHALLASAAAIGFMSETCEVVLVSGKDGPVRVNKDEFDADQEKPTQDRQFKAYRGKDEPEQPDHSDGRKTFAELGIEPVAAPSAPDFTPGEADAPLPVDPAKNAVAPSLVPPNDLLVMKDGKKCFVVNGMGVKQTEIAGIDADGYSTIAAAQAAIDNLAR